MTMRSGHFSKITFARGTHKVDVCWNWTQSDDATNSILLRNCILALKDSFGLKREIALQFCARPGSDIIVAERLIEYLRDECAFHNTECDKVSVIFETFAANDNWWLADGARNRGVRGKRKFNALSGEQMSHHTRICRDLDRAADLARAPSHLSSLPGVADIRECVAFHEGRRILIKSISHGTGNLKTVEEIE